MAHLRSAAWLPSTTETARMVLQAGPGQTCRRTRGDGSRADSCDARVALLDVGQQAVQVLHLISLGVLVHQPLQAGQALRTGERQSETRQYVSSV